MREIVVISGKGGTGKTTVSAAFAHLAENSIICDLDVDAPDLHILLDPDVKQTEPFISGNEAEIRQADCVHCGQCQKLCAFEAVSFDGSIYKVVPKGLVLISWLGDTTANVAATTVRIGDMAYAKEHSKIGDTYNITVRNIVSNTSCGINICKGLKDSLIENVVATERCKCGIAANDGGAEFINCTIRNVVTSSSDAVSVKPGGYKGDLTIE